MQLANRRIVVADDTPDTARLLQLFLEREGATVELAANGREAVDAVRRSQTAGPPIDLILMDMQMPVLDGYAATGELRAIGFHRPIIAITAHGLEYDRDACLRAGCDDYILKPFSRDTLLTIVVGWTKRRIRFGDVRKRVNQ